MTTQQETMRQLINLLEDVEQSSSQKIDPAVEKFNQRMLAVLEEIDPEQLDEVDWKKLAASGAVAAAALLSNMANAGGLPPIIDGTSDASAVASCAVIMMQASHIKGLDPKLQQLALNSAKQFNQISSIEFQKLAQTGNVKAMSSAQNAGNRTLQMLSKMNPQQKQDALLKAADVCLKAL